MSVLVGVAVTMLIQSSSATDVMVIGFVNSGLMNLFQAIGVIMGANIGTTITAQITAFNISAYAPVILFIGAAIGSVTPNILASLTANRNGKRTALLNLTFNIMRAAYLMILLAVFPVFLI